MKYLISFQFIKIINFQSVTMPTTIEYHAKSFILDEFKEQLVKNGIIPSIDTGVYITLFIKL